MAVADVDVVAGVAVVLTRVAVAGIVTAGVALPDATAGTATVLATHRTWTPTRGNDQRPHRMYKGKMQ